MLCIPARNSTLGFCYSLEEIIIPGLDSDGDPAGQDGDPVLGKTAEQELTSKIHKNKVAIIAEEEESWRVYPELV